MKDQELILRFLALYFDEEKYKSPMKEFLNSFALKNRTGKIASLEQCEDVFKNTIDLAAEALGNRAFRPETVINAAVYDSVMVGLARRFSSRKEPNVDAIKKQYTALLQNPDYLQAVNRATANEKSVIARLSLATLAFAEV